VALISANISNKKKSIIFINATMMFIAKMMMPSLFIDNARGYSSLVFYLFIFETNGHFIPFQNNTTKPHTLTCILHWCIWILHTFEL
jgi:hypothetical protein